MPCSSSGQIQGRNPTDPPPEAMLKGFKDSGEEARVFEQFHRACVCLGKGNNAKVKIDSARSEALAVL